MLSPQPNTVDTDASENPSAWPLRVLGAVAGLVAAAVALGVAELVAGLNRDWRSPVLDVGDRVVDNVPSWLKDFAIEQFGTNDKFVLLLTIGVVVAVYAMTLGVIAFRRSIAVALGGIALFGVIGIVLAATNRVGGTIDDGMPTLVGVLAGGAALYTAWRFTVPTLAERHDVDGDIEIVATGDASEPSADPTSTTTSGARDAVDIRQEHPTDAPTATRRQVLVRSGGILGAFALVGGGAGVLGRTLRSRFSATESRANAALPAATEPLPPIPDGVSVGVDGISPFTTPNADFYRIDTALTVPQVPIEGYTLRVHGMVDNEITLSYEELTSRQVEEYDITMTCVSNTIGGNLVGNARWLGVRLDELLADAGIQSGADQIVGRSVDGYTCGFPVEAATDGRNALVAFGMNGEPLPLEHGFPVRLVVPGLYGYVSATKWLTEIEVTTFADFEQYWVPRGYAVEAPIKLMSRIDSVDGLGTLTTGADGMAAIGGVAWAQTRGISGVEVQIDGGEWQPAELGEALNDDTWRQWAFRFQPSGTDRTRTSISVRAIDGDGMIQTDERAEPLPDGASGHHSIVVFVE